MSNDRLGTVLRKMAEDKNSSQYKDLFDEVIPYLKGAALDGNFSCKLSYGDYSAMEEDLMYEAIVEKRTLLSKLSNLSEKDKNKFIDYAVQQGVGVKFFGDKYPAVIITFSW
jgi:hypothetical protein